MILVLFSTLSIKYQSEATNILTHLTVKWESKGNKDSFPQLASINDQTKYLSSLLKHFKTKKKQIGPMVSLSSHSGGCGPELLESDLNPRMMGIRGLREEREKKSPEERQPCFKNTISYAGDTD